MILGSAAMIWGYVRSAMAGKERYGNREFRRFLRRYQWACLLRGKRRATKHLDAKQAASWRPTSAAD
jgi:poly-beta-1,6-N-acetyl-D-glucosamine synthase